MSGQGEEVKPKPTLVTTGTGSGKTECFMLPILGKLAKEAKAFECAHEMCITAAEEAEAAARVLGQCVSKWEAENLVW